MFISFLRRVVGSKKFFYVVVALLFVQAAWIALTMLYPMAFDESFHFGIIQFYSHQWLPFITTQPAGSEAYGDLTRYDSYMYHYLMSFPYRLVNLVIKEWLVQVIIMRFLNIGLFICGLFMFRKLLRTVNVSDALINFALFMLVLIPVVPFIAATINYDNLAFFMSPLFLYFVIICAKSMADKKKLPAIPFVYAIASGAICSLVTYAFDPIYIAGLLYLLIPWLRMPEKRKVLASLWQSFKEQTMLMRIILACILVIGGGLLTERYGENLVLYHSIQPDCEVIRNLSDCLQYGPWSRNYKLLENVKATKPAHDPPVALYAPTWIGTLMYRLYFAINNDFIEVPPLPLPIATASVIGGMGFILCLFFWRSILKTDRLLMLFLIVSILYMAGLFYINFTEYLKYHTLVAVNGRYLIPIMPLIFVWIGLAYKRLFTLRPSWFTPKVTALLCAIVTLLVLNGGGALTILVQGQPNWYWNNAPVPTINAALKKMVKPLIIGEKS